METRIVKFNIRQFVEDYIFARESGDNDAERELLDNFDNFFYSSSYQVKSGIQTYLFNNPIARQYTGLQDIATRCITNF